MVSPALERVNQDSSGSARRQKDEPGRRGGTRVRFLRDWDRPAADPLRVLLPRGPHLDLTGADFGGTFARSSASGPSRTSQTPRS